jgi:hypothetical protein
MSQTRLPNFLFVGSAKCGSTWIYRALKAHPHVFVPPAKDIYYFDRYYDKGPHWYASFFQNVPHTATAVGELSHDYLYSEQAAHRIASDLPDVRLFACIRNPIDRAFSAYQFMRRNGTAADDFEQTYRKAPNIVDRGRYAPWINLYSDVFGPQRFKVFLFDDLKTDAHAFAASIYRFLGVDDTFHYGDAEKKVLEASQARLPWVGSLTKRLARSARSHGYANLIGKVKDSAVTKLLYRQAPGAAREKWTPQQLQFLRDFYADDTKQVGRLLDRDLSHWLLEKRA